MEDAQVISTALISLNIKILRSQNQKIVCRGNLNYKKNILNKSKISF